MTWTVARHSSAYYEIVNDTGETAWNVTVECRNLDDTLPPTVTTFAMVLAGAAGMAAYHSGRAPQTRIAITWDQGGRQRRHDVVLA